MVATNTSVASAPWLRWTPVRPSPSWQTCLSNTVVPGVAGLGAFGPTTGQAARVPG